MKKHLKPIILLLVLLALTLPVLLKSCGDEPPQPQIQVDKTISSSLVENAQKTKEAVEAWLGLSNRRRDIIDPNITQTPDKADHLRLKFAQEELAELSLGSMIFILRTCVDSLVQYASMADSTSQDIDKIKAIREYFVQQIDTLESEPDPISVTVINASREAMVDYTGAVINPGQTLVLPRSDRKIGRVYEGSFKIDGHSFPYNPSEESVTYPNSYEWQKTGSSSYVLRKK